MLSLTKKTERDRRSKASMPLMHSSECSWIAGNPTIVLHRISTIFTLFLQAVSPSHCECLAGTTTTYALLQPELFPIKDHYSQRYMICLCSDTYFNPVSATFQLLMDQLLVSSLWSRSLSEQHSYFITNNSYEVNKKPKKACTCHAVVSTTNDTQKQYTIHGNNGHIILKLLDNDFIDHLMYLSMNVLFYADQCMKHFYQ